MPTQANSRCERRRACGGRLRRATDFRASFGPPVAAGDERIPGCPQRRPALPKGRRGRISPGTSVGRRSALSPCPSSVLFTEVLPAKCRPTCCFKASRVADAAAAELSVVPQRFLARTRRRPSHPADRVHGPPRLHEPRRVDLVPFPLLGYVFTNRLRQRRVVRPAARRNVPHVHLVEPRTEQLQRLPSAVRRSLGCSCGRTAATPTLSRPPCLSHLCRRSPSPGRAGRSPAPGPAGRPRAQSAPGFRERKAPCRAPTARRRSACTR